MSLKSLRIHNRPGRAPCSLEGCGQPMYARTFCVMHYDRHRRTGSTGTVERKRGPRGAGHIDPLGYRIVSAPGHVLATAQNKAFEHRIVLYEAIGEGPHPCYWCHEMLPWRGGSAHCINVDHLDWDRLNNTVENLVVSCLDCNTKRRMSNESQV